MMEDFDGIIIVNNPSSSSSTSINELVTCTHHFTIQGYSLLNDLGPGNYNSSNTFNVGGYDWIVYFYPDGLNPDDLAAYVSVYIVLASKVNEVRAYFEATLMDQTGKGNHWVLGRLDPAYKFDQKLPMHGFDRFYRKDALKSSVYLKNDTLEIKCTLKVIINRLETPSIEIPPSRMRTDFKYMLDSGLGADITFSVGDEKFRAHKLILSIRSSVFISLFDENPNLNEFKIDDIEPAVFKLMLHHIYTGELPNTLEFTTNTMHHLLAVAIRYDLDELRLFCEAKLGQEINVYNVATTLCLAEQHRSLDLKAFCINFVVKNLQDVMRSEGFEHLKESFPSLVSDILKATS